MLTVKFSTANAAFADGGCAEECAYILSVISIRLRNGETSGSVRDSNGNTVGTFKVTRKGETL